MKANVWIKVTDQLPPIDEENVWEKENQISKDVLVYSKDWGMRFGRFYHKSTHWVVDGVLSSNGIKVEYWMEVVPPEKR